jgi:inner membrane protein
MDTLTHMALGACIGQVVGYKKLGKKALLYGALCGLIPDLDVLYTPFLGEFGSWKYHRHLTHSLIIIPLLASLMAYGMWRYNNRQVGHLKNWMMVMWLAMLSHPLLDLCTVYGIQLLAPFSNMRFEISAVSIIDPIYSFILLIPLILLSFKKLRPYATVSAIVALLLSTAYVAYGWELNEHARNIAVAQLQEQKIPYREVESFTTIFQPFLRRIVVKQDDMMRVGFVSTLKPEHIYWGCRVQSNEPTKSAILNTEPGKIFDWFSMGNLSYSEHNTPDQVLVTDARYGVPGESLFGWWGQLYGLDHTDNHLSASYVGPIQVERGASLEAVKNMFKAAYGQENNFMMTRDINCP